MMPRGTIMSGTLEALREEQGDKVRRALTEVLQQYRPSVLIMHPHDAAAVGLCAWPALRRPRWIQKIASAKLRRRVVRGWLKTHPVRAARRERCRAYTPESPRYEWPKEERGRPLDWLKPTPLEVQQAVLRVEDLPHA